MIGTTVSLYRILDELGRGGMGVVYKAEDTKLDRIVALKLLPQGMLASEDDRARFYREARAAAALHHPNVATVFEIDAVPGPGGEPQPFIAIEFVDGESLSEVIKKGPLRAEEAISITAQIADGLHAAHEKGIVHRDIKPANIMLSSDWRPKTLDFGVARLEREAALTQTGSTIGTTAYMSPEQVRGEPVDRRSDLWSLGIVFHELLTSERPFLGDYEAVITFAILNEEPELGEKVSEDLRAVLRKLLAKGASDRYQTAQDLALELRGGGTSVQSQTSPESSAATARSVPSLSGSAPGSDLVWADRSGNVEGVIGVVGQNASDPLAASDGSRVVSQDDDGLWLYAGDRKARTRLTLGDRVAFSPTWFPGTNELAAGVYGGGSGDISMLDVSSPGRMYDLIASDEPEFHADFSPDGKFLVFYRIHPESNRDIMLAEVERSGDSLRVQGDIVPLVQTRFDEAYPEISPNGRFLAYHANRTGRWEIYLSLFPAGTAEWPVSTDGGRLPRWSPDGDELFYVDFAGNLVSVSIDALGDEPVIGEPVVLFNGEAFGHNLSAATLHNALYGVGPGGDRFIVVRRSQTSDFDAINVVENWYAEFERE